MSNQENELIDQVIWMANQIDLDSKAKIVLELASEFLLGAEADYVDIAIAEYDKAVDVATLYAAGYDDQASDLVEKYGH